MGQTILRNDWIQVARGFTWPTFKIGPASYFDDRAMIVIGFLYYTAYIHLPIHSGIDDCEYPQYGFYFMGNPNSGSKFYMFDSFWWVWGRKIKCFHMPWEWDWVRTSHMGKDESWIHETKGKKLDTWRDEWKKENLLQETYDYKYTLKNGQVQDRKAVVGVTEREWRWRWFKWFPFIKKVRRSIEVEFSDEVGERTGSWKGGTVGCGWDIKPGQSREECLRDMERTRVFN